MLDVKNYQLGYVLSRGKRELTRCKERLHIVEGIIFAIEHPIDILEIMLVSADGKSSKQKMCDAFGLSGQQAQAIIDMRMRAQDREEKANRRISKTVARTCGNGTQCSVQRGGIRCDK